LHRSGDADTRFADARSAAAISKVISAYSDHVARLCETMTLDRIAARIREELEDLD
jgi:hypothetical protein